MPFFLRVKSDGPRFFGLGLSKIQAGNDGFSEDQVRAAYNRGGRAGFGYFFPSFYNPAVIARQAPGRVPPARWATFVTWIILFLALTLRLYHLDAQSFSDDEFLSVLHTNVPLDRLLIGMPVDHTPGYWVLLHYWLSATGNVDFSLRFFSVLWGVLGVALSYALGRQLFSARVGLIAAALAAFSPFALYHSQEARMYSQLYVMSAAGLYTFARAFQSPSRSNWLAHLLALAGALYTHYYALALPFAEAVFLLLERRREKRAAVSGWAASLAGAALLFAPWTPWLWRLLYTRAWQLPVDPLTYPAQLWADFLAGTTMPGEALPPLAGFAFILFCAGVARARHKWQGRLVILTLVAPLAAALAALWLRSSGPLPRYFIALLPAFILLLALVAERAAAARPALALAAVMAYMAVSFVSLENYWFDAHYAHPDWRTAANWLEQHAQPGDLILFDGAEPSGPFSRYYHGRASVRPLPDFMAGASAAKVEAVLSRLVGSSPRVWVLLLAQAPGAGEAWLAQTGFKGDYEEFAGIYVTPHLLAPPLGPPQTPAAITTELPLTLDSFAVGAPQPGQLLPVLLNWRAVRSAPDGDYQVSLRLVDARGQVLNALDRPLGSEAAPLSLWKSGQVVADRYALALPEGLVPGTYELRVIVYAAADQRPRLQATLRRITIPARLTGHEGTGRRGS